MIVKIRQIVSRISQSLLSPLAAQIKYIFASPVFIFTRNSVPFLQFCTCMCPVSLVTYGRLSSTTGFFLCVMFVYAMFTYRFMVYLSILLNQRSFLLPCVSWLSIRSRNCSFFYIAIFPFFNFCHYTKPETKSFW
jgi:hypothetical protein